MAYPPSVLAVNRTDALSQQTTHPADHNLVNGAMNDVVAELGGNPSGTYATVQQRLDALQANAALAGCKWIIGGGNYPTGTTTLAPTAPQVTVDTGGYMDTPTSAFIRIPTGTVHAVSIHVTATLPFENGGFLTAISAGQSYLVSVLIPAGSQRAGGSFTTTFTATDTVSFQLAINGTAKIVSVNVSVFRV